MDAKGNKNIVLVIGEPASGKSSSLRYLKNPEQIAYLNADLKAIPFNNPNGDFGGEVDIEEAIDIFDYIDGIEEEASLTGGVLDTLTYLMDMYERQLVLNSSDTRAAWQNYGNYYKELIHRIKTGTKNYAILAHVENQQVELTDGTFEIKTKVPIKGSVGRKGIEGDFTTIVSAKRLTIKALDKYLKSCEEEKLEKNELLTITGSERRKGFKYVFQTDVTVDTIGEPIRAPMGLWKEQELYIDNDIELVFQRLNDFFNK